MGSLDDFLNVVARPFLEILFAAHFLLEMSASTHAIKLKFGHNEFGKRTVYNLQTRIRFSKKSRDQVHKNSLNDYIYQRVTPV